MIYEHCPNCGKGDFHSVSGTFWSSWAHCKKCQHTYSVVDEWVKAGRPSVRRAQNESGFLSSDFGKGIKLSNDVWMSDSGSISVGYKMLGSKCIGQKSPLIGDNSVLDHRGNFIGRTFEAGGRTYLDKRCW